MSSGILSTVFVTILLVGIALPVCFGKRYYGAYKTEAEDAYFFVIFHGEIDQTESHSAPSNNNDPTWPNDLWEVNVKIEEIDNAAQGNLQGDILKLDHEARHATALHPGERLVGFWARRYIDVRPQLLGQLMVLPFLRSLRHGKHGNVHLAVTVARANPAYQIQGYAHSGMGFHFANDENLNEKFESLKRKLKTRMARMKRRARRDDDTTSKPTPAPTPAPTLPQISAVGYLAVLPGDTSSQGAFGVMVEGVEPSPLISITIKEPGNDTDDLLSMDAVDWTIVPDNEDGETLGIIHLMTWNGSTATTMMPLVDYLKQEPEEPLDLVVDNGDNVLLKGELVEWREDGDVCRKPT